MRRTSRLLVLFGIGLAVLTFVVIVLLFGNNNANNTPQATAQADIQVVIALQDLTVGTTVTPEMLDTRKVPPTGANPGYLADPSQAVGNVVRQAVAAGGQVTASTFSAPNGAAAGVTVPPGKRAFAIEVSELTDVGNLVQVGDHVDVLISHRITVVQKNPDGSTSTVDGLEAALTVKMPLLLQDLEVIGTIDQPSVDTSAGAAPASSNAPTLTGLKRLLILAVTPQQAEVLLFSRTDGVIDVVLRSPQDEGQTATTDGVILKTLIDKYGVLPPNVVLISIP